MKIRLQGNELFHAEGRTDGQTDGQTDMTKLMAVFRNFSNAPKNGHVLTNFNKIPKK